MSAKLHRRVGKFLKVQLFFSAKWLMVSEVSFDSTEARGSYSDLETAPDTTPAENTPAPDPASDPEKEMNLMPVIVGALTTVIILLAAAIFFIVSRSRNRKRWDTKTPAAEVALTSEKIALNPSEPIHYSFFTEGPVSDSGSTSGSRSGGGVSRKVPIFDDNYNSPAMPPSFGSPRSPRAGTRGHTPASTPRLGGGPGHSSTPQRRIINNPLAEMPLYAEPFHVMHNNHYLRALVDTQETAILTGGLYSVLL